jgi:hypothetical protein
VRKANANHVHDTEIPRLPIITSRFLSLFHGSALVLVVGRIWTPANKHGTHGIHGRTKRNARVFPFFVPVDNDEGTAGPGERDRQRKGAMSGPIWKLSRASFFKGCPDIDPRIYID